MPVRALPLASNLMPFAGETDRVEALTVLMLAVDGIENAPLAESVNTAEEPSTAG